MRTKIIATIGPVSESEEVLKKMVESGLNIARLNFSHSTQEQFLDIKKKLAKISKQLKKPVQILQDLQGPRIRVGHIPNGGIHLEEGKIYPFGYGKNLPAGVIPINDADLHKDIKKGDPFFLANGELDLEVVKVEDKKIFAEVIKGGLLISNKAVNVPKTILRKGGLTKKDIEDVKFALEAGVDYIALSFVQSADDVKKLREVIGNHKNVKIISKIERGIAIENIDDIIKFSDGIMIARGDLGIEIPLEELPIVQKNLIRHAHWYNKPAIIATQMLTSMIRHSHPTRAEVSDIANAIFDGADSAMLSDETAVGQHPVEVVSYMKRIISHTENYISKRNFFDLNDVNSSK